MSSAPGHPDSQGVNFSGRLDLISSRAHKSPGRGAEFLACAIESIGDFGDVVGCEKGVGIAKRNELAARDTDRLIRCRRETAILRIHDLRAIGKVLVNPRNRFVSRRVVDMDQLDIAMSLAGDALEAAAQIRSA